MLLKKDGTMIGVQTSSYITSLKSPNPSFIATLKYINACTSGPEYYKKQLLRFR